MVNSMLIAQFIVTFPAFKQQFSIYIHIYYIVCNHLFRGEVKSEFSLGKFPLFQIKKPLNQISKQRGGSKKLKIMVEGELFVKKRGARGDWNFSYLFSSRFIIFTCKSHFTLCKIAFTIEEKLFLSATIISSKKPFLIV